MDSGWTVTGNPSGRESGPHPTEAHHTGGSHQGPAISKGSILTMSNNTTYTVAGMTCAHCVASVTEEVSEIPGVEDVQVDLASGAVAVTSNQPVSAEAVKAAVEDAGYQIA